MRSKTLILLAPAVALAAPTNSSFESSCASLAHNIQIENVTTWFSQYIPVGTTVDLSQDQDPSCMDGANSVPAITIAQDACRLAFKIDTSESSETNAEVWLPRNWTGRLLGAGTGGLAGCVGYQTLARGMELGFATVSSNAGHNGTSGRPFLNNEEIVRDWAIRSIHVSTVVAKQVIGSFYGKAHTKAYFSSCSNGGRQAIKEAAEFPKDYDGIIAGAPALSIYNLFASFGKYYLTTGPSEESSSFIPAAKWELVHQYVLQQCDGLDGLEDGFLEDPSACHIEPEALLCTPCESGQACDTSNCLTDAQVATLKTIYSPLLDSNGTEFFPAFTPGPEVKAFQWLFAGADALAVSGLLSEALQYIVYNDPTYNLTNATLDDFTLAIQKNVAGAGTNSANLSTFQHHGGKLLQYQGNIDPLVTESISSQYYTSVSRSMSLAPSSLDAFYRYFRISGMEHCQFGPGAWNFNQNTLLPGQYEVGADAEHDVLLAMVRWVEEGVPPETLTGRKFVGDDPKMGVEAEKRHCRFPWRNMYVGGDPDGVEAWVCVEGGLEG